MQQLLIALIVPIPPISALHSQSFPGVNTCVQRAPKGGAWWLPCRG